MDREHDIALIKSEAETEPAGAARVGYELRQVRERLGWRLPDVAGELRIRLPYLEAIERGALSELPGAAYQSGFVRAYAQALGLDGEEILRRFREAGSNFEHKAPLSFLAPVPDRAVPTGAIMLVGIVLVLAGYGLWYRHTAQDARLAAEVQPVPAELAPLALPPKPPAPQAAPMAPKPAAPASVAVAPAASTMAPATPPGPSVVTPAAAAINPAAPAVAEGQVIMATGDDWVQVQDAKNNILFSKTLHAGDSWPVPDLPGLTMTAGNAGATEIADNGKTGSPLGAQGAVIRNYALTPASPGTTSTPAATVPAPIPAPAVATPDAKAN